MLEVCFNTSVKGALALAQNCKRDVIGEAFAVITDSKWPFAKRKAIRKYRQRQIALQKLAIPLGGKKEDIVGITLLLSEGDIKAPVAPGSCPRRDYIASVLTFDPFRELDGAKESAEQFWRECMADLEKLQSAPDQIRLWVDHTPDAQCGLLWIADLFRESQTEIHVVELPEKMKIKWDDGGFSEYRTWGEVEPELYGTFLSEEKILTREEIHQLPDRWQELKAENAPLRVVENGAVISADVSYYDDKIRLEFPDEPCKISFLVGRALGWQNIPTGDVFIAKRIQHFIDNGELEVLKDPHEGFYQVVVQRAR